MAGELRRRGNKKRREKEEAATRETSQEQGSTSTTQHDDGQEDETLWQTFTRHPLVVVSPIILIPYALYTAYYFFRLQRPDLVTTATFGLIQMRPAVRTSDERQVLVVGTMGSGTMQAASDLSRKLQLEVGHDATNAESYFVRDGTVSWFHGIRFLEPAEEMSDRVKSWGTICLNFTDSMGFHPKLYRQSNCSSQQKWSKCWAKECLDILRAEWGCGLSNTCRTPFHKSLHQVRNPIATIEFLVATFCQGQGLNGTIHPSFVKFASALFPDHDFEKDSCIEATSQYVLDYTNALLSAQEAGAIGAMYQIEATSPCEVARLAGFLDPETVVYPPNYSKVMSICEREGLNPAKEAMTPADDHINLDLVVSLEWKDFGGGMHGSRRKDGDSQLEIQVKALMDKLGYSTDLKAEGPDQGEMYLLK